MQTADRESQLPPSNNPAAISRSVTCIAANSSLAASSRMEAADLASVRSGRTMAVAPNFEKFGRSHMGRHLVPTKIYPTKYSLAITLARCNRLFVAGTDILRRAAISDIVNSSKSRIKMTSL